MKPGNLLRSIGICFIIGVAFVLAACGGGSKQGSGTVGSSPTATTVLRLTLELRDAQNTRVTHVSVGQSVTAIAKVMQQVTETGPNGTYTSNRVAPNVTVLFATAGGTLSPPSGSVITDNDGIATATLIAGNAAGAFSLDGSVNALNTTGATAQISYSVDRVLEPNVSLRILDQGGALATQLRAGSVYTVEATATRVLTDITIPGDTGTASPAAEVLVTFATDGGTFDPSNGQVLTDASGHARVAFQAATLNGGFVMATTASIDDTTVTSGMPYSIRLPDLRLGSGTPFTPGVLATDHSTIAAGGGVIVTAQLRDETGALFVPAVPVSFSSACASHGSATIDTPVLTSAGQVLTRYVAGPGCYGADEIRANVLLDGATVPVTASATILIDRPVGSGILFQSNEPSAIVVRGRGSPTIPESALVTFKVTDPSGLPVPGATVSFALTQTVGTATVFPTTNTSGFDGVVTTRLQSGQVTGTTSVLATVVATGAQAQSAPITISNGRPTQRAFSLSAQSLNMEAANIDGVTNQIQVRLADRYGNPAPDGTAVRFTTSGAAITPSCTTLAGGCAVVLTSQAPRPGNGRAVILATSLGDESFTDSNANNLYDVGEVLEDLPEAWRDDNENRRFDAGEPFVDDDLDGRWSIANTLFDGADCKTGCGRPAATIRAPGVIVLSTSSARIVIEPSNLTMPPGATRGVAILVSDLNGNMMAGGTSIAITATNVTFNGEAAYTVADTNARGPFYIYGTITAPATEGVGSISVRVISPSGVESTGFASVGIAIPTSSQSGPISKVEITPASIDLDAGERRTVTLGVVAVQGEQPAFAAVGETPELLCDDRAANITARVDGVVQPTGQGGNTVLHLSLESGATASELHCRVQIGAAFAPLVIRAN